MASFSGSGGGRNSAQFVGPGNKVRSSGGFGAAAGITDLSGIFQANRQRAPRYDRMNATDVGNRAQERAAIMKAEANTHAAGLSALGNVTSQKIAADAAESAAQASAEGAKTGAMMSGIGSIIGAGLGLLSDETTKNNIQRIDDALTVLRDLKPVSFYYKEEFTSNFERKHHGFVAQDFKQVLPDATYFDDSIGKMCIDTGDLIGLLVRAVQQLETRVMYLEAQKALAGVK